jgi:hypothetical protein
MKKLITVAMLFVALAVFTACDHEAVITESKLPLSSREFLKTHFEGITVTRIVKETDSFDKDYTVYLENGFTVDFTKSGNWDEVDGHIRAVPQSILDLLPKGVVQYTDTTFAGNAIVKVNRERYGYEIELGGDIELAFSASGAFLRFD